MATSDDVSEAGGTIGPVTPLRSPRLLAGGRFAPAVARLNARHPWNHNHYFHSWILANLPDPCSTSLDVGCGRGELLAALAPHVDRVVGNDVDADMRDAASRRCAGLDNVTVTGEPWTDGDDTFDLVTMVAVLHHLDVPDALRQVLRRLRPGGRFLAVGLAPPETSLDLAWEVASIVTNPLIGYVVHPWPAHPDRAPAPVPVRDPTLTFDQLRRFLDHEMPGATIRHRLGFRHTIAWTRPRS